MSTAMDRSFHQNLPAALTLRDQWHEHSSKDCSSVLVATFNKLFNENISNKFPPARSNSAHVRQRLNQTPKSESRSNHKSSEKVVIFTA